MTVLWLICYLISGCPYVLAQDERAWIITFIACLAIDIFK